MDPFLQFLTWQFMLFCMFIFGITSIFRNAIESTFKDAITTKFWTKFVLPTFPLLLGGIAGFFLSGPYPEGVLNRDSQVVFGVVAGLFSGHLYRLVKGMIKARMDNPEDAEEELLSSVRGSINNTAETTITTTTTTSVPVIDGQPVVPVPSPVAVIPGVQVSEVQNTEGS